MSTRKRTQAGAVAVEEPTRRSTRTRAVQSKTPCKTLFQENDDDDHEDEDKVVTVKSTNNSGGKNDRSQGSSEGALSGHKRETEIETEKEIHYEFGGPIGALGVIVGLPVVIYALYFLCNDSVCMHNPLDFNWDSFAKQINFDTFFSTEGTVMYLGWMAFSVLLERILPGESVDGVVLPTADGAGNSKPPTKLKYVLSGHLQFWLCILAVGHAYPIFTSSTPSSSGTVVGGAQDSDMWSSVFRIHGFGPLPLHLIYDHYVPLISISVVFTTLLSFYL